MKPYLMDHVVNAAGEMVKAFTPEAYGNLMTASEAEALGTMMRAVVTEGTGSKLKNDQYTVAGKTGSAGSQRDRRGRRFRGCCSGTDCQSSV